MSARKGRPPPANKVRFTEIAAFNPNTMRCVYKCTTDIPLIATLRMGIWLKRDGRLLARFSSYGIDIKNLSFEIHGISPDSIPRHREGTRYSDAWLPKALRQKYKKWTLVQKALVYGPSSQT